MATTTVDGSIAEKPTGIQEVHVWHASLDAEQTVVAKLDELLSADERDRAGRFRFERDRRRFIAARGMLRAILGNWHGVDPRALRFGTGDHGKPHLIEEAVDDPVSFNAAHSGDHALFALADRSPVGVDIETLRNLPNALAIAERFFSSREIDAIRRVPDPQRMSAFFQCWTRKEAYVKAIGLGLSHPLDGFEVTMDADEPLRIRSASGDDNELNAWSLHDLSNLPLYAAAVAVQAPDVRIRLRPLALDRLAALSSGPCNPEAWASSG